MYILKQHLKLLSFVHKRHSPSFNDIQAKFKSLTNVEALLNELIYNNYIEQIGGSYSNLGEPIPITHETRFTLAPAGLSEVEHHQWFDGEFVIRNIVVPVFISLLTFILTSLLALLLHAL